MCDPDIPPEVFAEAQRGEIERRREEELIPALRALMHAMWHSGVGVMTITRTTNGNGNITANFRPDDGELQTVTVNIMELDNERRAADEAERFGTRS